MKTILAFALMIIAGAFAGTLAAADHRAHSSAHAPTAASANLDLGVVKKVDKAGGKVTLSHGALSNGMPAMTMAFRVANPAWLGQMKEGQQIRFAAEQIDSVMTVVRFDPVQ